MGQPCLVPLLRNPADKDRPARYSDKKSESKIPFEQGCCICGEGLYQHPFYLVYKTSERPNYFQTPSFNGPNTTFSIWDNAKNTGGDFNTKECLTPLKTFQSYYFSGLLPPIRRYHQQESSKHRRGRISRILAFIIISPTMLAVMSVFAGLSVSVSFILLNQRLHLNTSSPVMTSVRFSRRFGNCINPHSIRFSAF